MSKVTLRLFAGAREAAGTGAVEYEADNLAGLLSQAKIIVIGIKPKDLSHVLTDTYKLDPVDKEKKR